MEKEKYTSLLISVPCRGLKILPPSGLESFVEKARRGERVNPPTDLDKIKWALVLYSNILRKRYPTTNSGQEFMTQVCYERLDELTELANSMTMCIVEKWKNIAPDTEIAVILFGSTTRGLVKNSSHPDPSNIDLAVIGNIDDYHKELLYDAIRPTRKSTQEIILKNCSISDNSADIQNSGNAGVHIQNIEKLTKNDFQQTIEYLKANATALYDPAGIWSGLENEALVYLRDETNFLSKINNRKKHRQI